MSLAGRNLYSLFLLVVVLSSVLVSGDTKLVDAGGADFSYSKGCQRCLRVVEEIKEHSHIEIIKFAMEAMCFLTHRTWEIEVCRKLVDKMIDEIDTHSTKDICQGLRLCKRPV